MKFNFVGDIGIFKKFENLGIDPFKQICLPESDLNIGNFEFVIHKNRNKFFYDVQENYSCSADYFKGLNAGIFHGFGLANNHIMDYGLAGVEDLIELLSCFNLQTFGFSKNKDYSIGNYAHNGIRTGIIACVKKGRWSKDIHGYGPDTYDVREIINLIRTLKNELDHIIIFPHWGTELVSVPAKHDIVNARKFIDAGATAVIGHHPHVIQGVEEYKSGLIAYSLGSFIYMHEEELGYSSGNTNRYISLCLNLELNKTSIINYKCQYYKYNNLSKLPEKIESETNKVYINYVNNNIHNYKVYNIEKRKVLLKREINSFWIRLKINPLQTFKHYSSHLLQKLTKRKLT